MPPPATTHPAPVTLSRALASVGLTASLTVARQDGKPLEASDLAALRAAVASHDLEHAAPVSDDEAARIASLSTPATLAATGAELRAEGWPGAFLVERSGKLSERPPFLGRKLAQARAAF